MQFSAVLVPTAIEIKDRSKFSSDEESVYSWHGIKALAAPGMTSGQAFGAKPCALDHAVTVHCVVGIIGATG